MPYVNVAKPTTRNYSTVITTGKEHYDQSTVLYDDSSIFYDGVNMGLYTKVAKPSPTLALGQYIGFGAFTYAEASGDSYTRVSKPS